MNPEACLEVGIQENMEEEEGGSDFRRHFREHWYVIHCPRHLLGLLTSLKKMLEVTDFAAWNQHMATSSRHRGLLLLSSQKRAWQGLRHLSRYCY